MSGSQVNVSPTSTTTYPLTARNANGTSQRTITVAVIANPSPPPAVPTISGFTASPASIVSGASSPLMWSVSNATSVSITPNVGAVTGASVIVQPAQTTQYVLNATNAQGSVQATLTVAVDAAAPPPDHSGMGPYIDRNKIPSGEQGVSVDRVSSTSEHPAASDGTGAFRTVCGFSHMNFDDPIVYPGRPGAAHLHAFFGKPKSSHSYYKTATTTCTGARSPRTRRLPAAWSEYGYADNAEFVQKMYNFFSDNRDVLLFENTFSNGGGSNAWSLYPESNTNRIAEIRRASVEAWLTSAPARGAPMATESRMIALGTVAPDFALPDVVSGKTVTLAALPAKPLLVAFICNHCPFVKHILDEFVAFANEYRGKGLEVVAISSNDVTAYPQDGPQPMAKLARESRFSFPYLYDESQSVARAYDAVCTPDFFLFDGQRKLIYRGQFDNSRPMKLLTRVTGADIRAAADAVLRGQSPAAEQKPSVGCSIKWKAE